ncbi:MAG TPA: lytic murein transglycosylase [Gaiellaceae bacterium]|nr:lytic murein transglycosylase [Gaiellaceae bacterium]
MRRALPGIVAVLVAAVLPATAPAQAPLPSFTQPNGPGSITVPFNLSTPPDRPAVRSYEQLLALWQSAGQAYGVPWQVLAAINEIESNFGQNMGPSSAGALGWMQFIPSTWMRWGTDADGDGVADPWDPEDAVFSAARYLAAAGAHEDLERAIYAYNHAQWYVDDVLERAALFGDDPLAPGTGRLVFAASDVERRLRDARRDVARLGRALRTLDRRAAGLGEARLPLERRAGDPSLGEAEFREIQARLERADAFEATAAERRARLDSRLARAVSRVEALEQERGAAALSAPAPWAGGVPEPIGGYVFPVGGGPEAVSVAHVHHDYPAADIAAPEGSPLYALADATVVATFPEDEGRCGIGLKLLVEGGAAFIYCHLSYLEPHVVPGAALAAGAPVGLVGSTGNSTGPHLHLAFDPALAYPQEEPWFERFAGTAFSWQDAPTPERPRAARPRPARATAPAAVPPERVFRVVRTRVVRFSRG